VPDSAHLACRIGEFYASCSQNEDILLHSKPLLGWRFVGEAYMHGIMEGEVKDLLLESEDEFGEQIFRIE
jgi:hypothetical protein